MYLKQQVAYLFTQPVTSCVALLIIFKNVLQCTNTPPLTQGHSTFHIICFPTQGKGRITCLHVYVCALT